MFGDDDNAQAPLLDHPGEQGKGAGLCSLGGKWQADFETNLEERKKVKWFVRVMNILIIALGILAIVGSVFSMKSSFPLGAAPYYASGVGLLLAAVGVVGFSTTCKKCSMLAVVYFMVLLLMSVLVVWAMLYIACNTTEFEDKIRFSLQNNWASFMAAVPGTIKAQMTAKQMTCETMTKECWAQVKDYLQKDMLIVLAAASGLVIAQFGLLYASKQLLGTRTAVGSLLDSMDKAILLMGISATTCGAYLITSPADGAKELAVVMLAIGIAFVLLGTLFGQACDWVYENCCGSCNFAWTIATFVYAALSILVLAVAILMLAQESEMGSWVENNFDRLCDKKCSNLMAEKIDVAVGNPNCTETSNSTVSCDNLIPPKCFEAAIRGCDTTTAATAAITMKLFGHVEQIAWCLLLLFMFLVIQTLCKLYKWKYEDEEDELSYGGYGSTDGQ